MTLDVTSLNQRRAVHRWERVSVGDILERLRWSVIFTGGLPETVGGKVLKYKLRRQHADAYR